MDEYISKQKVLDYLNGYLHSLGEGGTDTLLFDRGQRRALINAIQDILAVKAADVQLIDRWISVKDRLPEENILVLCYARSTTGEGNDYFLGALAHGEFWFLKVNDIRHVSYPVLHWEVTHWQPLQEPPKDGENNE